VRALTERERGGLDLLKLAMVSVAVHPCLAMNGTMFMYVYDHRGRSSMHAFVGKIASLPRSSSWPNINSWAQFVLSSVCYFRPGWRCVEGVAAPCLSHIIHASCIHCCHTPVIIIHSTIHAS